MSRIPKWKVEKAKVKVVFRLQLHATQIPQGWDKLFVSFIPSDTGKATSKTTKANVRNGNCKWSDPIYETTRLLQDSRTKKYEEKLYKLVVAMGSSRSSLLGEVNLNLADFADALKPSYVALPLHCCDFETVLHITVQLLTSKTGFREFEQQRELSVKGFQMISGQRNGTAEGLAAPLDTAREQLAKVNARVRFREISELSSLEEALESTEDYEDSAAGVDGSSCTLERLYPEKKEISNMRDVESFTSTASGDAGRFSLSQNPSTTKVDQCEKHLSGQGSNEWVHGWSSDYYVENDLAAAYEENSKLRVRLEAAESAFLELKLEAKSLESITAKLGVETQNMAQQLVTELNSTENLKREVSILKLECSELKNDLEDLKTAKLVHHIPNKTHFPVILEHELSDHSFSRKPVDNAVASQQNYSLHDTQLKCLQGIFLIEDKIQEIQNKVCLEFHESEFNAHSDFKILQCVLQSLKQTIAQTTLEQIDGTKLKEIQARILQPEHFVQGQSSEGCSRDSRLPEDISCFLNGSLGGTNTLNKDFVAASFEDKMCEVIQELEESKIEKENLAKKMDEMECYYEALIQQLEESHKQTINELENLKTAHASSLYTISSLQSQIQKMHQEMNEQLIRFAQERNKLDSHNNDLEKRAILSETALKRVRWNYSIAVDRLQKDLELLSFQVLSMYETNENLAKQAFTNVPQLILQHYSEEPSEEEQFGMRDNRLSLPCKEQYKLSAPRFQSDFESELNHESSPVPNGVSLVSYRTVEKLDFNEDKGIMQNMLPRKTELLIEDFAHVNGLKSEDTRKLISETQGNNEFPSRSILESNQNFQGISSIKTKQITDQYTELGKQPLVDAHMLEEMKTSLDLLKELHSNTESDLSEMHINNMHLEVFSEVLRETLRDVNHEIGLMKHQMDKLRLQLADSINNQEFYMLRLHNAMDELTILKENETKFISKYNDLILQNHTLDTKLQDLSQENTCLTQKVSEYETLMVEDRITESKYKVCNEAKEELEHLLKQECLQRSHLQNEIDCLNAEFTALKDNYDKQCSAKDDLQNTLSSFQVKLQDLCAGTVYDIEKIDSPSLDSGSLQREFKCENGIDMLVYLEEFLAGAYKKIFQLRQERKEVEEQRDIAQHSLNKMESQLLSLKQKFDAELEEMAVKLDLSDAVSEKLHLELQGTVEKLKISLEAEKMQAIKNSDLSSRLTILGIELQHVSEENKDIIRKFLLLEAVNEELESAKFNFTNCMQENRTLMISLQSKNEAIMQLENELCSLKESLRCTNDELQAERILRQEIEATVTDLTSQLGDKGKQVLILDELKAELVHLDRRVLDVEAENHRFLQENKALAMSMQSRDKMYAQLEDELASSQESLRCTMDELQLERKLREELDSTVESLKLKLEEKGKQLLSFDELKNEMAHVGKRIFDIETENHGLLRENETLMMSMQSISETSTQMENELSRLKESLRCTQDKWQLERRLREELGSAVSDLTLHLGKNHERLLSFDELKDELVHLGERILGLETENSELQHLLSQKEESHRKLDAEQLSLCLIVEDMKYQFAATLEFSLTLDIEVTFMKSQLRYMMPELVGHCKALERKLEELNLNYLDVIASLEMHKINEAQLADENTRLSTANQSSTQIEVKDMNGSIEVMGVDLHQEQQKNIDDIGELKNMLVIYEAEIDRLRSSRDELEITDALIRSKLEEQRNQLSVLDACDYELKKLREQNGELSQKLSEQTLKTEEFKNLSIHLRELKDTAQAECCQAREKRESEGPSHAMQDSLRIAFIKEQYESKLQELRNQLFVSKKYADEMLLKLQNALNEAECAKKSEVSLVKIKEELSKKISGLETELKGVLSERRELRKDFDRMKAEFECTTLSLGCCREEKLELESTLQECNEDRTKLRVELDLVKRLLENMASVTDTQAEKNVDYGISENMSIAQLLENGASAFSVVCQETSSAAIVRYGSDSIIGGGVNSIHPSNGDDVNYIVSPPEVEGGKLACVEDSYASHLPNILRDHAISRSALKEEALLEDSKKRIAYIKEHFKEQQRLMSGMDHLQKELERLKNENSSPPLVEDSYSDPALQTLQRELTQLDEANEYLVSIFPFFNEIPGSGNALERVLALELELAEALQAKKKSDIRFQSSFLKQHNDETAVYQSFRDINDLIKDMLELKRMHGAVTAELKEMHSRYSQLSLQFAEVEGERQKLVMTLKNRLSKKS